MENVQTKTIGTGGPEIYPIGIGAMSWSGSKMWGYGNVVDLSGARAVVDAAAASGITFFDTAEIYGRGTSERVLGQILSERNRDDFIIATKYAPLPWRNHKRAVGKALSRSLENLQLPFVDLYQIHFPSKNVEAVVDSVAQAALDGGAKHIGVSNYSAEQMYKAAEILANYDVKLASNQVEYSLVKRSPEADGVLDACRELGASLIAYSPLGRGFLSGKYSPENPPKDWRKFSATFKGEKGSLAKPLLSVLTDIAASHGKTVAQVALNWLARDPVVVPIPGGRTAAHAEASAEAATFELSDAEVAQIDAQSEAFRTAVPSSFRS